MMGQSLSPQITVVGSKDPKADVPFLKKAFPEIQFSLDDSVSDDQVFVIESSMERGLLVQKVDEIERMSFALPIFNLREQDIDPLKKVSATHSNKTLSSGEECFFAVIKLPGGGSFACISPNTLESKEGRQWYLHIFGVYDETESRINGLTIEQTKDAVTEETQVDPSDLTNEGPKLPKFPTLDVSLLHANNEFRPYPTNSQSGVPFETELFKGKVLAILRPHNPEDDPYWNERIFSKRKRRIIVQVQGRFKRKPEGMLYAGGEISDPMKLGLLAKGMSSILLNLIKKFNKTVNYSFGDNKERAHIVVPAWTFFEKIVITKSGDEPPAMGETFPESKESISRRKNSNGFHDWNTENTYSMSYYSMYIDLPHWQIVRVPVTQDIDLRTFWGKSFMQIIVYENEDKHKDDRHLTNENIYYMALRIKHFPDRKDDEKAESLPWNSQLRRIDSTIEFSMNDNGSTQLTQEAPALHEEDLVSASSDGFFFDADEPSDSYVLQYDEMPLDQRVRIDQICPMWIDMLVNSKYTRVYAFNLREKRKTVFRTGQNAAECLNMSSAQRAFDDLLWSPRLSQSEKMRRMLGQGYELTLKSPKMASKLHAFHTKTTEFDQKFLKLPEPNLPEKRKIGIKKSGFVARALSDRHWIEEWAKITGSQIAFYHPERQKSTHRITLDSIIKVEAMSLESAPHMPTHAFMELQTLGRTVYLMFPTQKMRDEWTEYLQDHARFEIGDLRSQGSTESRDSVASDHLLAVDDPTEEFLHKSTMWDCKQRRILNCRKLCFLSKGEVSRNPNKAVEFALAKALEPKDNTDERHLIQFLDSVAMLKEVRVESLSEKERLAFFLNLYHVMILHAFLVLGPPDSTFKWISYFNTIAYQCSDDVFSLTELEHNIIRASMNFPSQFVSKFVLPKSQFRFALKTNDFRINFALNSGSRSNPSSIPIYKTDKVETQLELASRMYLHNSVEVSVRRNTTVMTLPRICQWYADDFGKHGSTTALLKAIEGLLTDSHRRNLMSCWSAADNRYHDVTVKFLPYSFDCRYLTEVEEQTD